VFLHIQRFLDSQRKRVGGARSNELLRFCFNPGHAEVHDQEVCCMGLSEQIRRVRIWSAKGSFFGKVELAQLLESRNIGKQKTAYSKRSFLLSTVNC